jgi:hypothetical protein
MKSEIIESIQEEKVEEEREQPLLRVPLHKLQEEK